MPDEFDIIFELMAGFFVETIILLVILIRLDQPRDSTPTNHRPSASSIQPPQADKSAATTRQPGSADTCPTEQAAESADLPGQHWQVEGSAEAR
ncbi:hypothetical protein OG555_37115 [Kribbella sp. NBC_01484]|uniref:hypothetical protein n=1 Tax=Kribbella sp. NBC_01484 TaxID=2903579 RepID=UPI002E31F2BB|nr:hypothetical protein [Kribbella sp. NBC_01484]